MSIFYKFIVTLVLLFPFTKIEMWKYALASMVTLYLFKKSYPEDFKLRLGIQFKKSHIPWAIAVLVAFAWGTEWFIQSTLEESSIIKESPVILGLWFLQPFFQSLNEEMILRSLFLQWLDEKLSSRSQWLTNLFMATLFTLLHFLFCKLLFKTDMNVLAGVILFLGTILMNMIYFKTGNILFTWAIHMGINFSFFGGEYLTQAGMKLNDAEKFNLIYSSHYFVTILTLVMSLVYYWAKQHKRNL